MAKSTGRKDAPQREELQPCAFIGCCGCSMCDHATSQFPPLPSTKSVTRTRRLSSRLSEVSPRNLYADIVAGSPIGTPPQTGRSSPGQTRGHLSDDVTPDISEQCDKLSFLEGNDVNEEVNKQNQRPGPTLMEPCTTNKKRQTWTIEEKLEVYRCYYEATKKGLKVVNGTYEIWRVRNPLNRPTINANKLNNQRRIIEKFLTESEKEEIKREFVPNESQEQFNADEMVAEPCSDAIRTVLNDVEEEMLDLMELSDGELRMKDELIVMYNMVKSEGLEGRIRPKKFAMNKENRDKLKSMNKILTTLVNEERYIGINELNSLHYTAAVVLAGEQNPFDKTQHKEKPDPDIHINKNIEKVRKWIGRMTMAKRNGLTPKVENFLKGESIDHRIQNNKMKLAALSKKLRTRISNRERYRNNNLYRTNQKAFYSTMRSGGEGVGKVVEPPPKEELKEFWENLYSDKGGHREDAEWLRKEEEDMKNIKEAKWQEITCDEMLTTVKKLANWKSPGLDQVQNFWMKHLTSLHPKLTDVINHTVQHPKEAPRWYTRGRTNLLHKKGPTTVAKNYRPITCLPTYYKLTTLLLSNRVYTHVTDNGILPVEQKGVRRKARGCKDHLLLDKIITEDAKRKKKNVSMMWVDYKKAYDSIPHSWLVKMLKLYKIDAITSKFIIELMPTWCTKIYLHYENGTISTDDIKYGRGIFQGDTLSPLLFCLCLVPITNILKRENFGYKIGNKKVSNLLYIDDLKIYAKNDIEMERCKAMIQEFSNDITMEFGLEKCAVIHMKRGEVINSPIVASIPILTGEKSYRYLGIVQADKILHDKVKESTKKEYFGRVRAILRKEISGINTTSSIKTFAMPILRYGFGVIRWTQGELRAIDCKTRKIMYKHKFHHPKSNLHRLYLSRKRGGRGLIGAMDCHRQECTKLAEYIKDVTWDPLVEIVRDEEKGKAYGIMSYLDRKRGGTTEQIDKEHLDEMMKMKLHGDYFKQRDGIVNVDLAKSEQWNEQTHLRFETESLLCAAQEQALHTKYMTSKIWGCGNDTKCRLCREQNETVHHIVSGCKMLAGNQYTFRHNQVAKYLHWWILKDRGVKVSNTWLKHVPESTISTGDFIIMWDVTIPTDKNVKCNRPDITIHDTKKRTCMFIDVAIPACRNVVKKEAEKIVKYRDLEIEIQKSWNLAKISTIPVIVGALGTTCVSISEYIKSISPNIEFRIIQKTALLGTAHILRSFLKPRNAK